MITGEEIDTLAGILETREAYLYHACQLLDFESYLRVGGIASQSLLDSEGLPYTVNSRGQTDPDKGTRDKIFTSLSDLGAQFARTLSCTPNPCGPILLQIRPAALREASDIAVCLTPAGANRTFEEGLALHDVPYLFRYTPEAPLPEKSYLKSQEQLQRDFRTAKATEPEVYCTMAEGKLPFDHVSIVLVDNYVVFERQLRDWVHDIELKHGYKLPTQRRYCPADVGGDVAEAIAKTLLSDLPTLEDLMQHPTERLRKWAEQIMAKGLAKEFHEYARALRNGTLLPLKNNLDDYIRHEPVPQPSPSTQEDAIPNTTQDLIDKLVSEKIPLSSISRITDLPESLLQDYIKRKFP